ncbi:MAG TPA: hypothetical protein VN841_19830, partial [Bryobacteraceae bacterium]|nr:hypothetical protein [Bryobacteraceae bacterium]
MKLKLKHLRHPLRTAKVAKARVAERVNMARLAAQGDRRFAGDPRYDLQSVAAGFADRLEERIDENDDAALLERICAAYIKAVKHQQLAPEVYRASDWWEQVRQGNLAPVMHALLVSCPNGSCDKSSGVRGEGTLGVAANAGENLVCRFGPDEGSGIFVV